MSIRIQNRDVRVGIASVGLGRIQRGYERYFNDIYGALKNEVAITLYKSAGAQSAREKVPPMLGAAMAAARLVPFRAVAGGAEYRAYKGDCLAFALTLAPDLVGGKIDVMHVIDYPLAIALVHLRRLTRFNARILFSDGGLMPPQYYPRADHIHHVAQVHYDEALAWGIPKARMTMVPCGLNTRRFAAATNRAQLRKKHAVAENALVILAVTAVKRIHKRVDHIIDEAARVKGDFVLWIDGKLEDKSLVAMARDKLGNRCRVTHVTTAEVPELYGAADVFVHGALEEGFGLTVCEAAANGLPVIAHHSPHFRWLLGSEASLVDMSVPGPLSRRLQEIVEMPRTACSRSTTLAATIRDRFDWSSLVPAYADMYRRVAAIAV